MASKLFLLRCSFILAAEYGVGNNFLNVLVSRGSIVSDVLAIYVNNKLLDGFLAS